MDWGYSFIQLSEYMIRLARFTVLCPSDITDDLVDERKYVPEEQLHIMNSFLTLPHFAFCPAISPGDSFFTPCFGVEIEKLNVYSIRWVD